MPALFDKIDCYSVPVDDLDAAIGFYGGALGDELMWRASGCAPFRGTRGRIGS